MEKAKKNAILKLLVFLLVVAGGVYTALVGLGDDDRSTIINDPTATETDAPQIGRAKDIALGLDLRGGVSVTYEIEEKDATDDQINTTIEKLQKRVDTYSTDGEVYRQGDDRITVEVPVDTSKYDPNAILDDLGRPGKLEFMDTETYQKWVAGEEYEPQLTGSDIVNSQAAKDTQKNEYIVELQFSDEGATKFATVTGANIGKPLYIVYDNQEVSHPTVQTEITGGNATIDGQATYEEAASLASTIKIGALPLTLKELSSQVVGARLGTDALSSALKAGLIGLLLIFVLMIIVFRFPGFVAAIALSAYTVLLLVSLNLLHISLTLPGLAGIILSIGMAVDANVIIFTRIKEEIGNGNNVKGAVQAGFQKALSAIIDGNVTTVIAGIVLLIMGTGTVKGFAKTLILGIVLSMFTALFITRLLLNIFVALGVTNKKMYGQQKTKKVYPYSKGFKFASVFSILVIVCGIAFVFVNKGIDGRGQTLNYSLEFSGGASTTVTFDKAYTVEEAEAEVAPVFAEATGVDAGKIQITTVDGTNQVVFKTTNLDENQRTELANSLKEKFNITNDKIETENISNTISSETQRDAILAVVISSILMLIYIAFRFSDVRFGAAAVLALIHDVMFVFFAYSVMYLSVGGTFIACMLTIVGYSINSTIIIFDRIRENIQVMDPKKVSYDEIVNTSISQTFTRNIYTNLTTFVTVLMLFILGVASLKEFTLTLMVGLVAGTYSSICITGPMWLMMRKHIGKKKAVKKAKA